MEKMFRHNRCELPMRKMKTHLVVQNKWRDTVQCMKKECPPQFHYVWMALYAASQTHHALWLPGKHSLAWLWQRRCYQLHRLTHFSLSPRALQSELCDHSSHFTVAGRHLHHTRLELHGLGCQHTEWYLLPPPNWHTNMYRTYTVMYTRVSALGKSLCVYD